MVLVRKTVSIKNDHCSFKSIQTAQNGMHSVVAASKSQCHLPINLYHQPVKDIKVSKSCRVTFITLQICEKS